MGWEGRSHRLLGGCREEAWHGWAEARGQILENICATEQIHSISPSQGSFWFTERGYAPHTGFLCWKTPASPLSLYLNPDTFNMSSEAHSIWGGPRQEGGSTCSDLPSHSPPCLPSWLISPADSINQLDATAAESQAIMENRPGALELTHTEGPERPPSRQRGGVEAGQ